MRVLVLGTPDDALGFGFAGAATRTPETARELAAALAHVGDDGPVGLVLVSAPVAALSPRAVRDFTESAFAPPLLVLPERLEHESAR